jgi:hypothetical protein
MTSVKDVVAPSPRVEAREPEPQPEQRGAKVDGTFPQLVWAHFRWQEELRASHELEAPAEKAYFRALTKFERRHGDIVSAYWCRYEASAVAITRKRRRSWRSWWREDSELRYHSATHWATEREPEIARLLQASDTLAIKISEVLRGTPELIGLQLLRCCAAYLLSGVDQTERRSSRAEIRVMTGHAHRELDHVENYYLRAGMQASRMVYVQGMVWGVLLAALLAAVTVTGVHLFTGLDVHTESFQTFIATYAAGAVGAVMSVLSRMGATPGPGRGQGFTIDFEVGRKAVRKLGALRPLTGAVFALALYFAMQSKLLTFPIPNEQQPVYFYLVIGFVAGFSERVTSVLLSTTAEKVLPGSAPGGDPAPSQGAPPADGAAAPIAGSTVRT